MSTDPNYLVCFIVNFPFNLDNHADIRYSRSIAILTGAFAMNPRKTVAFTHQNDTKFAVGNFYPVQTVFSYHELGGTTSPFLLLDHLGPAKLAPKSN